MSKRKAFSPKDHDEVRCDLHDFATTWGELDEIQKLAVKEGIDTIETLPCILDRSRKQS